MKIRNHKHFFADNRGQTLVEFALVVALLLAILFGIAEFGRAWFYSNHLTNATRAAARYGAVLGSGYSDAAVMAYLTQEIDNTDADGGPLHAADIDTGQSYVRWVDANGSGGTSPDKGDIIEVRVTYNFNFVVGSFFLEIFSKDATWKLTRSASMQFEGTQ